LQKGYTQKLWISIIGRAIGQAVQLPPLMKAEAGDSPQA